MGNAPLHEFEGKNLGIRFARGEYVVCTNQGKSLMPREEELYCPIPEDPNTSFT